MVYILLKKKDVFIIIKQYIKILLLIYRATFTFLKF